ncbi:MAG: redoxin domain-containing protein [Candidatus Blackburnbacteria bacterium]|nr:redoxin domain-containing protein [Candidatus Blackburnbacteria bacterium]
MKNWIFLGLLVVGVFVVGAVSGQMLLGEQAGTGTDKEKGVVGKRAPDFELGDYGGNTVKLSGLKGKPVLLFFNEGLMCYPACWDQIDAFGKDTRFQESGIEVFSIVVDQPVNWKGALAKMPSLARAKVLFDATKGVSRTYDVLNTESSMHKGSYPGHTYVGINKDGVIEFVWDDPEMAIRNDELLGKMGVAASSPKTYIQKLRAQDQGQGEVGVNTTLDSIPEGDEGEYIVWASFDTHSADLVKFDILKNAVLVVGGETVSPVRWDEEAGASAHHRSGKLVFKGKKLDPKELALIVRNLAGVKERKLVWSQ